MTEYATDPEVIQEFLHARNRTANWVSVHSRGVNFVSASSPPSMISDEDAPSYGPSESDASSSHSTPPRMLLRYDDGRPDVPISHEHSSSSSPTHSRSSARPPSSRHSQPRSRSGSLSPTDPRRAPAYGQPSSLSYASGSRYAAAAAASLNAAPENIRVLPSRQAEDSQRPRASSSSHQRHASGQALFPPHAPSIHDRVPPLADPLHASNRAPHPHPPSHPRPSANQPIPIPASPPTVGPSAQPHNGGSRFYERPGMAASQAGLPYSYSPPAIVYAPSGRHHRSNYQPPAIVYSPSSHHRRAPGMAFSRSDPTPQPTRYSPETNAGHTPFPSVQGSVSQGRPRHQSLSAADRESPRGRSFAPTSGRDRMRTRSPTPSLESDTMSDSSGSTYYVLPSPGQKVQIIVSVYRHYLTSLSRSPNVREGCTSAALRDRAFSQFGTSTTADLAAPCISFCAISTTEITMCNASHALLRLPLPFIFVIVRLSRSSNTDASTGTQLRVDIHADAAGESPAHPAHAVVAVLSFVLGQHEEAVLRTDILPRLWLGGLARLQRPG